MLEFISTGIMLLSMSIMVIGSLLILLSTKAEINIVGMIIMIVALFIVHSNHSRYLEDTFIKECFEQGDKLVCGLWIGEKTLISKDSGWRWDKDVAFVKQDQIFSAPGLCRVLGKEPPQPPFFAYAGILVVLIALLVAIRSLIMGTIEEKGEDHDTE